MNTNAPNLTGISASITLVLCSLVLSASLAHSAESRLDGKWQMDITYSRMSSSNPRCQGHLLPDPLVITNGKLSGLLNQSEGQTCRIQGTINQKGELQNAKCYGAREISLEGRMERDVGNGTWIESEMNSCDGLWTAKKIK